MGSATEPLFGGFVMITIGRHVALGGGGSVLARTFHVGGDPVYPDRVLGFGYGGLAIEVAAPPLAYAIDPAIRLLVGAGNADLTDNATGTRLQSDNVFVVEPEIVLRRRLTSWLRVGASASYRFMRGVDRIDTDATGDLESFALGVGISIGPL